MINITIKSGESDRIIDKIRPYINESMNGLDIGSAGKPIFIQAISLDKDKKFSDSLVQLRGNAINLYWFKNKVLDYVFSSHCWEDFNTKDKSIAIKEWLRVIKINGYLILYLPDQRRYEEICLRDKRPPNGAHKDKDFNIEKAKRLINEAVGNDIELVYEEDNIPEYNFLLVYKRLK